MVGKFFTAPENMAFVVALCIMGAIGLLVIVGSLAGFFGDSVELEGAEPSGSAFEAVSDWLGVTAMPASIFFIASTASFFITGFLIQWGAYSQSGGFLPGWITIPPSLAASLLVTRLTGRVFRKFKVKVDTSAVHGDTFVGKSAVVVGSQATVDLPAEAKLTDEFGQVHYFLVRPSRPSDSFPQGTEVVLLRREGPTYIAACVDGFDKGAYDEADASASPQSNAH